MTCLPCSAHHYLNSIISQTYMRTKTTRNATAVSICAAVLTLLSACTQTGGQRPVVENAVAGEEEVVLTDSVGTQDEEDGYGLPNGKSLNDIRFAHFEEKDWLDNEYIRTLRRYLDDFLSGTIEDEELEQYRDEVKGQFAVYRVEPFLGGGMFMQIVFVDNPDNIFWVHVYSDVDIVEEKVTGYHVNDIMLGEMNSGITKEELLRAAAEHPEFRLW